MEIKLTKSQKDYLKYILKIEQQNLQGLLNQESSCVDMRYCRNSLKVTNNILEKIS